MTMGMIFPTLLPLRGEVLEKSVLHYLWTLETHTLFVKGLLHTGYMVTGEKMDEIIFLHHLPFNVDYPV
jgi:hypothetical protein